jgi:hypothetical protein
VSADPIDVLRLIELRLARSTAPAALIEEMLPHTHDEAVTWARRLPIWEEYRGCCPARVIALARLISRRAMQEHDLILTEDGRVTERPREATRRPTPQPALVFALCGGEAEIRVEYTPAYFAGRDHFQFRSPHEPVQPIPLSETGWYSHFAHRDAVEACGGPEAYAALFAEARRDGREDEFVAAFEGASPQVKCLRRARKERPGRPEQPPAPGGHAGGVTERGAQGDDEEAPPGRLF